MKVDNNPFLQQVRGMFGDTMVVRKVRGKYQLANRPSRGRTKFTEKQSATQEKFQEAAQYAKNHAKLAFADPASTVYSDGITENKHNVYLVAMSDYLNPPKVKFIKAAGYKGAVGQTIEVSAKDDFRVKSVAVDITDGNGTLLESGEAIQSVENLAIWKYQATVENTAVQGTTINAIATDFAGNTGLLAITL